MASARVAEGVGGGRRMEGSGLVCLGLRFQSFVFRACDLGFKARE